MAKRILVPLAMHPQADAFVIAIGDLARGAGGTVRLLHVARPAQHVTDVDGRLVAYADQETLRLDAEAHDYLDTIALMLDGIPVERGVRFGDPADEILAEVADFGADLVVLGVGRKRRFLMPGGVAEEVFRRVEVPVALLRALRPEAGGR